MGLIVQQKGDGQEGVGLVGALVGGGQADVGLVWLTDRRLTGRCGVCC